MIDTQDGRIVIDGNVTTVKIRGYISGLQWQSIENYLRKNAWAVGAEIKTQSHSEYVILKTVFYTVTGTLQSVRQFTELLDNDTLECLEWFQVTIERNEPEAIDA